jgi:hypothetical protein
MTTNAQSWHRQPGEPLIHTLLRQGEKVAARIINGVSVGQE